jgi:hypothetical protein
MFQPWKKPSHKEERNARLVYVLLEHETQGTPVHRSFYWLCDGAIANDPLAVEEAFAFVLSNLGISRDKVTQFELIPVAANLSTAFVSIGLE